MSHIGDIRGSLRFSIAVCSSRSAQRWKGPPFQAGPGESHLGTKSDYTLKDEPQPQVDFTWGFSNLKPAASRVST